MRRHDALPKRRVSILEKSVLKIRKNLKNVLDMVWVW
jgi:hypothetical protein